MLKRIYLCLFRFLPVEPADSDIQATLPRVPIHIRDHVEPFFLFEKKNENKI